MSARRIPLAWLCAWLSVLVVVPPSPASSQDLFEIQVYPYDTVEPGHTMLEFHTNFIPSGTTDAGDGVYANDRQMHLTIEVTHGFTPFFEVGFYIETAPYVPDVGSKFTGWHIRPRFRFPESKTFPFKVSLSLEYAFNRPGFNPNTQTLELRPIFERQNGRLYLSINPDLSVAIRGPESGSAPTLEPNAKIGWDVSTKISAGIEYYAETGPVKHFDPLSQQHHILLPAIDLNLSPDWELNFGVGRGLTNTSEHWILKGIVGYRFKR